MVRSVDEKIVAVRKLFVTHHSQENGVVTLESTRSVREAEEAKENGRQRAFRGFPRKDWIIGFE